MANKNALVISICIFIIVAVAALLIVFNKGHIGSVSLVKTQEVEAEEKNEEVIMPKLEIAVENEYLSSTKKEKAKLSAVIDGEEVLEGIEYKSSDESVAKIKDGQVIAVKDGRATITGIYEGVEDSVDIHVITPVTSMTFTSTNSTIKVGKDLQMKLQLKPSDASISTLKYTSSDEEIATVNANGIVTGIAPGKVTITVTDSYTGMEKSVKLTIKK